MSSTKNKFEVNNNFFMHYLVFLNKNLDIKKGGEADFKIITSGKFKESSNI